MDISSLIYYSRSSIRSFSSWLVKTVSNVSRGRSLCKRSFVVLMSGLIMYIGSSVI